MITICASLGYKSPFLCPLGREREANQAKQALADGSKSDLIALVRAAFRHLAMPPFELASTSPGRPAAEAYEGWKTGRADFARRNFLSNETMDTCVPTSSSVGVTLPELEPREPKTP